MKSTLEVHENELLPQVLDKAYKVKLLSSLFCSFLFPIFSHQLIKLALHVPIERCCLVKYNYYNHTMDQSLDLDEVRNSVLFYCFIFNLVSASNY